MTGIANMFNPGKAGPPRNETPSPAPKNKGWYRVRS